MPSAIFSLPGRSLSYFGDFLRRISDRIGKWHPFALIVCAIFGLAFFGACLTAYVIFVPGHPYILQTISSVIKLPIIFILSAFLAAIVTFVIAKITRQPLKMRGIARASLVALFSTATCLTILGPIIALFSSQGNYSKVILASYGVFLIGTLVGSLFFYMQTLRLAGGGYLALSLVWCVLFTSSTANIGWELRPLVGWTGQPFELVRGNTGNMWSQVECEMKNMRFGGIHFPSAGEESSTKAWPC
jgi:MFS family permease